MASALDLSQNVRPSNTNLQNVVSFWETSSARPLPVLCPWTLLGDLHPQTSWLPPLQNSKYANTEKLSLCNWLLEAVIESGFLWWVQLFHSYAVLSVLAEVICLKCRELCTMKSVYQLAYLTHIHWQNVLTVYSGFSNDYYWLLRMCLWFVIQTSSYWTVQTVCNLSPSLCQFHFCSFLWFRPVHPTSYAAPGCLVEAFFNRLSIDFWLTLLFVR